MRGMSRERLEDLRLLAAGTPTDREHLWRALREALDAVGWYREKLLSIAKHGDPLESDHPSLECAAEFWRIAMTAFDWEIP